MHNDSEKAKSADFDAAAKQHGGKHAHAVKTVHDAIASGSDEKTRLHAAIDAWIANLQKMKHDGSTIDDLVAAAQHTLEGKDIIKKAIKSGVQK